MPDRAHTFAVSVAESAGDRLFKDFAVRDGRLITGQQQYSGTKVAALVIATLGT